MQSVSRLLAKLDAMPATNIDLKDAVREKLLAHKARCLATAPCRVSKRDVVLEVQSMLPSLAIPGGWQVAKSIVGLASQPADTWKRIGPSGRRRPMIQAEAARIVSDAQTRIDLVDSE